MFMQCNVQRPNKFAMHIQEIVITVKYLKRFFVFFLFGLEYRIVKY